MPNSRNQPRSPSPDVNDIEADFNPKLTRLGRDDGFRPPPKLQVTTELHPFWHTKRGMVIIALAVLAIIGAIVGGVIGGTKGKNDTSKRTLGTTPTPMATSATTPMSTTTSTTRSRSSKKPTSSSSAMGTESLTVTARAYPIRRELSFESVPSAILVVQAPLAMTSPPS